MTRILITGGCGFIGHHVVEHILKNTDWDIVLIDKLGYSSFGFGRLRDIQVYDDRRINIFTHDFARPITRDMRDEIGWLDYIIHMGAETHVDNSIQDPYPFVESNIIGTFNMLEFAKKVSDLKAFVYFSTDEVFGPAPKGIWYREWDRYNSTNPYSATKAGGEELAMAWANTYGLPVVVTHTMNVFGERQHPEKFIPMTIRKVLLGETVTIHADTTKTISGTRHYIHARNVASALLFILYRTSLASRPIRDKYNIVGEMEVSNLEMAQYISDILGKPLNYEMVDFHSSRPGHDLRYALDGTLLKEMGWEIPLNFYDSLRNTINWYLREENQKWLLDS